MNPGDSQTVEKTIHSAVTFTEAGSFFLAAFVTTAETDQILCQNQAREDHGHMSSGTIQSQCFEEVAGVILFFCLIAGECVFSRTGFSSAGEISMSLKDVSFTSIVRLSAQVVPGPEVKDPTLLSSASGRVMKAGHPQVDCSGTEGGFGTSRPMPSSLLMMSSMPLVFNGTNGVVKVVAVP